MREITLEELLEAGCHFGHQVTRQNPKARDFVFEARDNIHIIDLAKTKEGLDSAALFVKNLAKKGGTMIVLGSKRQAEPVVREEAIRIKEAGVDGLYFVTNRWIGGILTNFGEVSKNFKKLQDLNKFMNTPSERARFKKKEIAVMEKARLKLESFYWGVLDMPTVPQAVFVIDTHKEYIAVREAIATNITTVGITDTNSDPTLINYPIPANDDAAGSVKLLVNHIIDAWIEGRKEMGTEEAEPAKKEKKVVKEEVVADKKVAVESKDTKETAVKKEVKPAEKKTEEKVKKVTKAPKKAAAK